MYHKYVYLLRFINFGTKSKVFAFKMQNQSDQNAVKLMSSWLKYYC